jgi:hypothetical protein
MDEEKGREGDGDQAPGSNSYWILWAFVALLALYVLSTGPVIKICHQHGNRTTVAAVSAVYKPLEFLYHRSSIVKRGFDWYFHVWGIK